MKTFVLLSVLLGSTSVMAAQAPSAAECQSIWQQASQSAQNHQSLSQSEASRYISSSNFKQADSNSDGQINQSEFQTACTSGLVQSQSNQQPSSSSQSNQPPANKPAE